MQLPFPNKRSFGGSTDAVGLVAMMPISSRRDLDPTVPERQGLSLSQQGASVSVRRGTRGERVDVRQTMKPRTNVQ